MPVFIGRILSRLARSRGPHWRRARCEPGSKRAGLSRKSVLRTTSYLGAVAAESRRRRNARATGHRAPPLELELDRRPGSLRLGCLRADSHVVEQEVALDPGLVD